MQTSKQVVEGFLGRVGQNFVATAKAEAGGPWSRVPLESIPVGVREEMQRQVSFIGRDPAYCMYTFDSCANPGTLARGYRIYVAYQDRVYRLSIEGQAWCINVSPIASHHHRCCGCHGPHGLGQAPPYRLIDGATVVDSAIARAACTGGWRLRSTEGGYPMTQQTVAIANARGDGDVDYILYEDRLYRINSSGGGFGTLYVCSSFDKSKLLPTMPPSTTPPIPGPPGPPGPVTPVVFKPGEQPPAQAKSSWIPLLLVGAAAAAGIGAAVYFSSEEKKKGKQPILSSLMRARRT